MGMTRHDGGELTWAQVKELTESKRVVLFGNEICPFAHRAFWAAEKSGMNYDYVHVPLRNKPDWYVEHINPAGTVPTLVTGNNDTIFESRTIMDYISATNGDFLYQGVSPENRARMTNFMDTISVGPLYGLLRMDDPAQQPQAKEKAKAVLSKLERGFTNQAALNATTGPYFAGAQFTGVEVALVPFLFRFKHTLGHYRGFDIFDGCDRLKAVLRASESDSAFVTTRMASQQVIEGYELYAHGARSIQPPSLLTKVKRSGVLPVLAAGLAGVALGLGLSRLQNSKK